MTERATTHFVFDRAEIGYRWAWHLLNGLVEAGLAWLVMSPGSRSTPLALAALRHPGLTTRVVIDERAAAFFALGVAKATGRPVAVVGTSGSAAANWFPAVVEADMARVPLMLLSADRPPELHDRGANQTMDQQALFGGHVRACTTLPPPEAEAGWLVGVAARLAAVSLGPLAGPVHLNLPFREPLVPAAGLPPPVGRLPPCRLPATLHPEPAAFEALDAVMATGAGAIVCGVDDLGVAGRAAVRALAARLGVPILADILSGLRCDCQIRDLDAGEPVLAHPDQVARTAPPADWLLRLGGTPVSRALGDWIGCARGRPQIIVAAHPRVADATDTATHVLCADPAALCRGLATATPAAPASTAWLKRFLALDRAAADAAERACGGQRPFEGALARALLRAVPVGTAVFLGNSLAVRGAEWFAGRVPVRLRLFGNRGVSGIDGNLATAFGVAAALGPTLAVVGDLAFLHDLNALALGRHAPLVTVVLDNGGGGIFDHLTQAGLPEFETGWLAPQTVEIAAAAEAFGVSWCRAETVDAAVAAVLAGLDATRASVVHVPIAREHSLLQVRAFHAACRTA